MWDIILGRFRRAAGDRPDLGRGDDHLHLEGESEVSEAVLGTEEQDGLVELFGGIGAGLAAVLRAGVAVKEWIYVEKDGQVRKMAERHAKRLQKEHPELLEEAVISKAMAGTLTDEKVVYLLEHLDMEGDCREP
ncbi:unnamed protein product, partial [Closterium sp. NIES-53]